MTIDLDTLYEMVKSSKESSERMASKNVSGYKAFFKDYNKYIELAKPMMGNEFEDIFSSINIEHEEYHENVRSLAEIAVARLTTLESYLRTQTQLPKRQLMAIIDIIKSNLRLSIFNEPNDEKEIQNTLEIIFRSRGLDYRRESPPIQYSSKSFIPDFSFESLNLALEVKFCNSYSKMKDIIDEINADIPAYQTRYTSAVFVIYDLGHIRDEQEFRTSIESNPNVYVIIQKH